MYGNIVIGRIVVRVENFCFLGFSLGREVSEGRVYRF